MIHPLPLTPVDLAAYGAQVGAADLREAARLLASAIACSPGWERFPGCSLLVRSEPAALALVGELTASQQQELAAQADALRHRCHQFRYVSYRQAEAETERLAMTVAPWLQEVEWRESHFVAVPRGGHLVLGMLATLLNLPRERLQHPVDPSIPVVVVDDCALSGTRFRQFLGSLPAERVAFAHLYSAGELRQAIAVAEPRVRRCVAATDLAPVPAAMAAGASWWDELPAEAYWRGRAEFVAFAWGEPDRVLGDPAGGPPLAGWKLLPPELCLKHRKLPQLPIRQQAPGVPPLQPAPHLFFVEDGAEVWVGGTGGALTRLSGVAATVWQLLVETGSRSDTAAAILARFEADEAAVRGDVDQLVAQFKALGVLVEHS